VSVHVKSLGLPLAPVVDWDIFEGDVRCAEVVDGSEASDLRIYDVTFPPGGRTPMHAHTVDQVLYIVSGHGFVQTEGGSERPVRTGDLVIIPAGERHAHGATEATEMCHLAVMTEGADVL
jgi:quercetin dioxygenase-like cupin family protein